MKTKSIFFKIFSCPYCSHDIEQLRDEVYCLNCSVSFPILDGNTLDFRLKKTKSVTVTHKLNCNSLDEGLSTTIYSGFLTKNQSGISFDSDKLPAHISPEMASYYLVAKTKKSVCLDLGCGHGEYQEFIEKLGYIWCGIDYSRSGAPILADAHALPFQSDSFELISSLAVLEHLKFPDVALREAFRVLQPGGTFIGSVTYLVPFHDMASYYNFTHAGLISSLLGAGFEITIIGGETNYLGVQALAYSGLFIGLNRKITYFLVSPLVVLQKLWWRFKRRKQNKKFSLENECTLNTGAFVFVVTKPVT